LKMTHLMETPYFILPSYNSGRYLGLLVTAESMET
jgi:hypothetical protein